MHVQLYELAQKYGPVMKIYIFTKPVVVLNTADVIHEALIKRGIVYLNVVHLNSLLKTKMISKNLLYLLRISMCMTVESVSTIISLVGVIVWATWVRSRENITLNRTCRSESLGCPGSGTIVLKSAEYQ